MSSLPPILLVDDDSDDLFILRRLLNKAGVQNKTVAFEDPRAAVAHLEAEIARGDKIYYPCLAITDLHMPQMNGFAFTEWVRSQPALADTTVIMVSSSEDPKDKARAIQAGARHFFLKYPPASALERAVAEAKCG
jgi:CheY-like chemotaxis protein